MPSILIGARPKTKALDIKHGLLGVIEKGLDMHGRVAIAQMDIRRDYDSIAVLRVHRYFVNRGCDASAAACLLRLHCCPSGSLCWGVSCITIQGRTVGALTGTRTAGLLGRVPVEDVISKRHVFWEKLAFKTTSDTLALATYIDNIFSTGHSAEDAIAILQDCVTGCI